MNPTDEELDELERRVKGDPDAQALYEQYLSALADMLDAQDQGHDIKPHEAAVSVAKQELDWKLERI